MGGRQESERERLTLHIHSHPLTAHSNKWILTGTEGGGVKEEMGGSRGEGGVRAFKAQTAPLCCCGGRA